MIQTVPTRDTSSNIFDTSVSYINGRLVMTFSREMITNDTTDQDISIEQATYWIWAFGNVESISPFHLLYHGSHNRGVFQTQVLLPSPKECSGNICICEYMNHYPVVYM